MEGEFLSETAEPTPQKKKSHSEIFREQFPFYLSIGMSSKEYWEGDVLLPKYFLEAYKLRQEQEDYNSWLQGMYFYDAVSTAMYNALKGKGEQQQTYAKEPYLYQQKEQKKAEYQEAKKKEAEAQAMVWMENLVKGYAR